MDKILTFLSFPLLSKAIYKHSVITKCNISSASQHTNTKQMTFVHTEALDEH